jgi:hypothetical protein
MKFYKNTILLRFKGSKGNKWASNQKIFNRLYNDYYIRNFKKENMKKNRFNSQSELYSFSPLINLSGYTTSFTPKTKINSPNSTRFNSYRKTNPINQNWDTNSEYNPLWRRNTLTEGNLYGDKNPNKYKDYNYFTNNDYNNNENIIPGYPNDYLYNSKIRKPGYFNKNILNNTDYGFYTPNNNAKNRRNNRNRNIYSNKDDEINNQISQYLDNFRNNNKKIDDYMNTSGKFSPKKRSKSNNKYIKGHHFDISGKVKDNERPYNTNVDNYFNKQSGKKGTKLINNNKNTAKKNNSLKKRDENNKKIYNDSKDYFYSFNKENNKNDIKNNNNSKKNSNVSLNPSSLGTKTFYTNRPTTTNNNLNTGNGVLSNINSVSSRMLDTQYHFLNGLKMTSGEVNEYFYDFNNNRKGKNDDDEKTTQSLQSLSDSKMLKLANYYINEEDDSIENYQMNNVVYNRRHNM